MPDIRGNDSQVTSMSDRSHWNAAYSRKDESELSWHQSDPSVSLELMKMAGLTAVTSVIDVGAGTSRLVDALLSKGLTDLTVLDVSDAALDATRSRLGSNAHLVTWITGDITRWRPTRTFDVWHDRAVFHFLVYPEDRAAYIANLSGALAAGGHAVIATFAPDGPLKCSGLPVARYSPELLAQTLGDRFVLVGKRVQRHTTPWGQPQSFQYSLFRRG
jgi:trans-aconitate methyltransferase